MKQQKSTQMSTMRLVVAALVFTLIFLSGFFSTVLGANAQLAKDRLDEDLQKGYDIFLEAFKAGKMTEDYQVGETVIDLAGADIGVESDIFNALKAVLDDYPEYDYIDWRAIASWRNASEYIKISMAGAFTNARIEPYQDIEVFNKEINAMNEKIDFLVSEAEKKDTVYEQLKYIHDWLATNNEYNRDLINGGSASERSEFAASAFLSDNSNDGPISEGYAEAFKIICNRLDIPCLFISGMNHKWNAVKLYGEWYGVDVTWDDPILESSDKSNVKHTYFLVGKNTETEDGETFRRDHIPYSGYEHIVIADEAFDPNAEIENLTIAKNNKVAEIESAYNTYKQSDYRVAQWSELKAIFDNAKATVNSAADLATVDAVNVSELKTQADNIKTDKELTEEVLEKVKNNKIIVIEAAFGTYDENNYRTAEWTALKAIFDNAKATVNSAADLATVNAVKVSELKAQANNIKTDAELDVEALKVPTITTATANGKELNIEWETVENATGYKVAVYNCTYKTWRYYETSETDYQIQTQIGGRKYEVKVASLYKADGITAKTEYSESVDIIVPLDTPELTYAGVGSNAKQIRVKWKAVSGATSYEVSIYNPKTDELKTHKLKGLTLNVDVSEGGITYIVKVKAISDFTESEYTSNRNAKKITTVEIPTEIKAKANGLNLNINWKKAKGADSYRVGVYNFTTKKWTYEDTTKTHLKIETEVGGTKYKVVIASLVKNDANRYVRTAYNFDNAVFITTKE